MFSDTNDNHLSASNLANGHLKVWESALALRVSLQKPLDGSSLLPVGALVDAGDSEIPVKMKGLGELLAKQIIELTSALDTYAGVKRKANEIADLDRQWEMTLQTQTQLQKQKWEPVLNKWHARLNFGSESTKAKLKVFTQTMWDQIENTLQDDQRSTTKSRMPWVESRRIGRADEEVAEAQRQQSGNGSSDSYDLEVYDDRMFYSMLLKTFITSASGAGVGSGGGELGATMRAGDLAALRQYKRKKLNVERKASKGRKVRYNVHDKLQNFMFPLAHVGNAEVAGVDAEKLFQSLFQ